MRHGRLFWVLLVGKRIRWKGWNSETGKVFWKNNMLHHEASEIQWFFCPSWQGPGRTSWKISTGAKDSGSINSYRPIFKQRPVVYQDEMVRTKHVLATFVFGVKKREWTLPQYLILLKLSWDVRILATQSHTAIHFAQKNLALGSEVHILIAKSVSTLLYQISVVRWNLSIGGAEVNGDAPKSILVHYLISKRPTGHFFRELLWWYYPASPFRGSPWGSLSKRSFWWPPSNWENLSWEIPVTWRKPLREKTSRWWWCKT